MLYYQDVNRAYGPFATPFAATEHMAEVGIVDPLPLTQTPIAGAVAPSAEFLAMVAANTFTLYSVEFCNNGLGFYSRSWHASAEAANAKRDALIASGYFNPELPMEGAEGCIGEVEMVTVPKTLEDLVAFANNYAGDTTAY